VVTGLSDDDARWYNTSLDTFITPDPAQSDPNTYRYAFDTPATLNDPTGLGGPGNPGTTLTESINSSDPGYCDGNITGAAEQIGFANWNNLTPAQLASVQKYATPSEFYALRVKRGLQDVPTPGFVPLSDDAATALVQRALSSAALASVPLPSPPPSTASLNNYGNSGPQLSNRPYTAWYKQPFVYGALVFAKGGQVISSPLRLLDTRPNSAISRYFAEKDSVLDDMAADCGVVKYGPTDKFLDVVATTGPLFLGSAPVEDPHVAGSYLTAKAPYQVTPGTRVLNGQYVNDLGRVEPWTAHYDQFGRLTARTDFNAGNNAAGIPDIHYHTYEWGPGKTPSPTGDHLPGEYQP
jgi:hypothetical protein